MNLIDAVGIGLVLFKISLGFLFGFLKEVCTVLSLIGSALAAYLCYVKGGSPLTILLVFFLSSVILQIASRIGIKAWRTKKAKVSFLNRIAGGALGSFEGILSVVFLAIVLHFLKGVIGLVNPSIEESINNSALYSRYQAVSTSVSIPGVKELYGLGELLRAKERAESIDPVIVRTLQENASVKAILEDTQMLESIRRQDFGRIIMNPKCINILNDRELVRQLVALGLKKSFPQETLSEGLVEELTVSTKKLVRLEGIVFSESAPLVIIGSDIYPLGAKVGGGKIVEITPDKMTVQFPDSRKEYPVGAEVP